MTRLIVLANAAAAGETGADLIEAAVAADPALVLGVATGSSPLGIWAALARRRLDVSRVSAFALDEYLGLPPDHPESYRAVVARDIIRPLGLDPARVRTPDAQGDPEAAARDYEAAIVDAGGVDLQVLGIGRNGHIGFNEPGSSLAAPTHVAELSAETRRDNARYFSSLEDMPTRCITQGIGTILRARRLVLIALGEAKAQAVAAAIDGPVTSSLPASALQLHPDATVLVDPAAASCLARHRVAS